MSDRTIKLWIDDERPAPSFFNCQCVNAAGAIKFIDRYWNEILHISLDHDLGEGENGYDVICFIEEKIASGIKLEFTIECHSANPVGSKRIWQVIDKIKGM